jgi:uncharacterized protein (UPF0333 family)
MNTLAMQKRGQIVNEYMVLAGILLVILIPAYIYGANIIGSDVRLNNAQEITDKIAAKMSSMARAPSGSADCMYISAPRGIISTTIAGKEVIINIEARKTINSINSKAYSRLNYYSVLDLSSPGIQELCFYNQYEDANYRTPTVGTVCKFPCPTPAAGDGCQILSEYLTGSPDPDCDEDSDFLNPAAASAYDDKKTCGNNIVEGSEQCETPLDCDVNGDMCLGCECIWVTDPNGVFSGGNGQLPPNLKNPNNPETLCGNDQIDSGEQCDPPGAKVCEDGKGGFDACLSNCKCPGIELKSGLQCFMATGTGSYSGTKCCADQIDCDGLAAEEGGAYICSFVSTICKDAEPGNCGACIALSVLIEDGEIPNTGNVKDDDNPETAALYGQMTGRSIEALGGNDNSIRFRPLPAGQNTGQINPEDPTLLNSMTHLQFDVRKLNNGATPLYIKLNLNNNGVGVTTSQLKINDYIAGSSIPNDEYSTITIPLTDFSIDNTKDILLNSLMFEGEPNQIYYLDNIQVIIN